MHHARTSVLCQRYFSIWPCHILASHCTPQVAERTTVPLLILHGKHPSWLYEKASNAFCQIQWRDCCQHRQHQLYALSVCTECTVSLHRALLCTVGSTTDALVSMILCTFGCTVPQSQHGSSQWARRQIVPFVVLAWDSTCFGRGCGSSW